MRAGKGLDEIFAFITFLIGCHPSHPPQTREKIGSEIRWEGGVSLVCYGVVYGEYRCLRVGMSGPLALARTIAVP